MRILFVTNFYPPNGLGGQAQSCRQVVDALRERGYATAVLTSMYGTGNRPTQEDAASLTEDAASLTEDAASLTEDAASLTEDAASLTEDAASLTEDAVTRALYLEMNFAPWLHMITFFTDRKRREAHNIGHFQQLADAFRPDVIFIWGMWNIARSLAQHVESAYAGRVLYRFADYWPTLPSQHELYWRQRGRRWFSRAPKSLLRPLALKMLESEQDAAPLKFEHAFCISAATKQALLKEGVPIEHARVIHNGIDVGEFAREAGANANGSAGLRLLYAGRLAQEKGVSLAIRAVSKLVHEQGVAGLSLDIAGEGSDEFVASLRHLVRKQNAQRFIRFLGPIAADDMPGLFHSHDVVLVPSVWEEPFGRVVVEAMASGVAVIASSIGGPAEIIVDGETGLLFRPGDVEGLAARIREVVEKASLRRRLIENGLTVVAREFTTSRMVDEIEAYLEEIVNEDLLPLEGRFKNLPFNLSAVSSDCF